MNPIARSRRGCQVQDAALRACQGTAALVMFATLCACSTLSSSTIDAAQVADSDLYEGEPQVVHATEFPVGSAGEARQRAAAALAAGDVDLALYLYVQVVTLDPADSESLYVIGAIHDRKGNAGLAARAYTQVVALDPDHAPALLGLGIIQFEARDFDRAEQTLRDALRVNPRIWRAHDTLGVIADMREQHAAAITHYTAAMELNPTAASIANNRGYSRYLAGDLQAAEQDFLKAIELDPQYERAWKNLGLVYARRQDYGPAVRALSRVMPRHVAANDIGYVAMLDGNYEAADAMFEEAVLTSPRYYETAQQNIAELHRLQAQETIALER